MIISRTPFRISFFGGGTDYPAWFREHGGAVLAMSINRYCYVTCRHLPPFFEHKSRVVWSKIELVADRAHIEHPAIRAALEFLDVPNGVEIHLDGDLPARSGLGSSSAAAVGVLNALYALMGRSASKRDLATGAIHVEQVMLRESVGVQDQIQTAYGGINHIAIERDGWFEASPVVLSEHERARLESHLMLVYTGVSRQASDVAAAQIAATPMRGHELQAMHDLVGAGIDALRKHDLEEFGSLLHETWVLKRGLTDKIAPRFVHDIYDLAVRAGAMGGKLLGAGGGGFMLFFAHPVNQAAIRAALEPLVVVPVRLDRGGSQIIFFDHPQEQQRPMPIDAFEFVG